MLSNATYKRKYSDKNEDFHISVALAAREVPAHSSCHEHEHRWKHQNYVCNDINQGKIFLFSKLSYFFDTALK